MTDDSLDDAFVPLAFSLHANPGAYAVLSGAGTSLGAGLPSAWGIMVKLANRIRRIKEGGDAELLTEKTLAPWWVETCGSDPTYSGILEQVGPTQYEREAALREFFEPAADDAADDARGPSATHHAIAELMAAGVIRFVVTLNFDHLFEDALRARGIEPTVVSTDAVAGTLPPLQTVKHCIVHLHGDYKDAASMLNTSTELGGYQPHTHKLVERIVADHGLLIAGWSVEHDRALRDIVTANHRRYYTHAWITPGELNEAAASVATALGARILHTTADTSFARLADAVTTMGRRDERDPLTASVVVDRIKRDLTGTHPAITAHDTLHAEFARLAARPVLTTSGQSHRNTDDYASHIEQIAAACQVPAAAVAALAYWGSSSTDSWWLPVIEQWSRRDTTGGLIAYGNLPLTVAVRLYYAAGVAATAAGRYDVLATLFANPVSITDQNSQRACLALDWWSVHDAAADDAVAVSRIDLAKAVGTALGLSDARIETVWQEFETLRAAATILSSPAFTVAKIDALLAALETFDLYGDEASPERRAAWIHVDRTTGDIAALAQRGGSPHVEIVDMSNTGQRWTSPVADRTGSNTAAMQALVDLADGVPVDRRNDALTAARFGAPQVFRMDAGRVGFAITAPRWWLDDKRPGRD